MITRILKIENERRKMLLEFVKRVFSEAEVEGIQIPQIDKPDGFEIAIRVKKLTTAPSLSGQEEPL